MSETYDLVVVGGGAAGLAAIFHARFRGARVALVQDGPIGGECTFSGCVPSKALLAAAARGERFDEAMASVRGVVERIAAEESVATLRSRGFEIVEGRASLTGIEGEVSVEGRTLRADRIVLATGSRPFVPPIPGVDAAPYVTNESLFDLDALPRRFGIVGGGPIGCEMAQAFSGLGSEVTLLEGAPHLLPRDDAGASEIVASSLRAGGVDVRTSSTVSSIGSEGAAAVLHVQEGRVDRQVIVDQVLVAVGRAPATAPDELAEVGVRTTDRGWIDVDEHLRTSREDVYAVGDAVGSVQLTHAGAAMAAVAVDNALRAGTRRFRPARWRPDAMPWTTFTKPEVSQLGVTEAGAVEIDGALVAELPMAKVDRAITDGRTEGFVKLIAAPRRGLGSAGGGRLIGATIVGDRAGELIGELALAHRTGAFVGRLAQTVHPYPTWSMAIGLAASQFFTDVYTGQRARPPRS